MSVPPPPLLSGITSLGFMLYPTYRLAVVGIVAVALLALFLVLYRTRLGMIVRAGIDDPVMVDSLGINVDRVFMIVFGIGAMAAGFAGIVNAARWFRSRPRWARPSCADVRRCRDGGVGSFPAQCWAASSPARSSASPR
jgi:branched-subunit amino acid ABC-type transport system permease component